MLNIDIYSCKTCAMMMTVDNEVQKVKWVKDFDIPFEQDESIIDYVHRVSVNDPTYTFVWSDSSELYCTRQFLLPRGTLISHMSPDGKSFDATTVHFNGTKVKIDTTIEFIPMHLLGLQHVFTPEKHTFLRRYNLRMMDEKYLTAPHVFSDTDGKLWRAISNCLIEVV